MAYRPSSVRDEVSSGREGYILGESHIYFRRGVYSGREGYILGESHIYV